MPVFIVLVSTIAVMSPALRATKAGAQVATNEPKQPAKAQDKDDDEDKEQAQNQADEKERERERKEAEQEKLQEKQEREQERQEAERERAEKLYEKGTKALNKRQWADAVKLFEELTKNGGDRVEGAHYWKAYGEYKEGQFKEALATYEAFVKAFPQSRWLNDAKQLEVEIRQASGRPVNPEGETDEELKLMALNGLMHADSQRALPLLQKLLESTQPLKIKEQALFILSQSGSPKTREILAEFARGKANLDMQLKSLEFLALFGGKESRQSLADAYASTDDKRIKRAVLGFFMLGGERDRLLAAAKREKDTDLRREAIGELGMLGAKDELAQLYQTETEAEAKKKIMEAMFIGGNADKLTELAQNEKDPAMRSKAIELMGPMGSEKTGAGLVALYDKEKDKDIREKVIEALFVQRDAKALVEIVRKEIDPDLKKKAVEQLSVMNSKEGAEYFMELLNK